jgi:hypothetical protein
MSAVLYFVTMTLHALPFYLVSGPYSILNAPGRGIDRARTRMSFPRSWFMILLYKKTLPTPLHSLCVVNQI